MNKLYINILLLISLVSTNIIFGQGRSETSNISDCSGAIVLHKSKNIQPQFTKNSGAINDLEAYSNELEKFETNSLWLKFTTGNSGILRLAFKKSNFSLEYSLFILNPDENCNTLINKKATLVRHKVLDNQVSLFKIDSIDYKKNQTIYVCLNTMSNTKKEIEIQNIFIKKETQEEKKDIEPKLYDFRKISTEKPFHIMIRDMKTNQPIIAKVIVSGTKKHDALYKASDFIFPNKASLKMELKISVRGYFFKDVQINNRGKSSAEKIILLKPLEKNQLINLESIKFESQSDVFLPEALPKVRRLRDFMVINPDVEIEIQGHVNLLGKNTSTAKRLSKNRAKAVREFLINNGIDKYRISVLGFGNSKMIYPKAETVEEEQANRRVEVRIK